MFEPVLVPGQGEEPTPEVLLAEIDGWISSEPLLALLERFGAEYRDYMAHTGRLIPRFRASLVLPV